MLLIVIKVIELISPCIVFCFVFVFVFVFVFRLIASNNITSLSVDMVGRLTEMAKLYVPT